MKKILLPALFITLSFSMKAQEIIDRNTFKNAPYETVLELANNDVTLLKAEFNSLTEIQTKSLTELYYYKYKTLSTETTTEELINLTNSMKERTKAILGNETFLELSENENLFYRLSGLVYLAQ